tara:strand:- start:5460 stop:7592 length:2133 start_codon:yes stop_codon:yes gene_type:complete
MANIRKQFNFRNGVQVDNDNLVVSPTGLVGIGTTIPTEALDVRSGNATISGFVTATQLRGQSLVVSGVGDFDTVNFNKSIGAGVSIATGFITATDPTGIVTYYGDARFLQGMPTSQWTDIDVGLGYTSIYNKGNVGIATDDPRFTLQVGGGINTTAFNVGVGIHSTGDIFATGIVTAFSYTGIGSELVLLNADNIELGTISNDRIPVLENSKIPNNVSVAGIITAGSGFFGNITGDVTGDVTGNLTGNVTGIATGAEGLVGTPDVIVGILTANAVAASSFIGGITGDVTGTASTARSLTSTADVDIDDLTVGVATVSTLLSANFIGVGTDSDITGDITVRRTGATSIQLTSGIGTSVNHPSVVSFGSTTSLVKDSGALRYNNTDLSYPYSLYQSVDLINYGNGNLNFYLDRGDSGIGTGNYYWHHKIDQLMTLTYTGNLGIGKTDPTAKLEVSGLTSTTQIFVQDGIDLGTDLTIGGNVSAVGAAASVTVRQIYVQQGQSGLLNADGTEIINLNSNNIPLNITTGISTITGLINEGITRFNDDETAGGGVSINPLSYTLPPFAAVQVGHPVDFFTTDPLGIGGTIDNNSVSDVTLIEGGSVGIGTTAIDENTALLVYGDSVIERLAIGVGVTQMNTGVLNVRGPILVSKGSLDGQLNSGTDSADINTVGIVTAQMGFMTGAGTTGVHIDVNGSIITFSVPGVGTTTLTLS